MPTSRQHTWIVVADRQQARFFTHAGPGARLLPAGIDDIFVDSHQDPNSDRPGRVQDRMNSSRHAMEPTTTYQDKGRIQLSRRVSDVLDQGFDQGSYSQLILIAGPETLGEIRLALSDRVRKVIVRQVEKSVIEDKIPALADRLSELEMIGRVSPH